MSQNMNKNDDDNRQSSSIFVEGFNFELNRKNYCKKGIMILQITRSVLWYI